MGGVFGYERPIWLDTGQNELTRSYAALMAATKRNAMLPRATVSWLTLISKSFSTGLITTA